MDILRLMLEDLNVDVYNDRASLSALASITKVNSRSKRKADLIDALYRFYSDLDSGPKLYASLTTYERALLTCIVQSKYKPLMSEIKEIAKQNNYVPEGKSYYNNDNLNRYISKKSNLRAILIDGWVPPIIRDYLNHIIPPYVRTFNACTVSKPGDYAPIEGRERRYRDFDMLLSFVNSNNAAATKSSGYMSKTALLKFQKIAGYDEVCHNDSGYIEDIRNAGDTVVSMGMVQLLRCADVLDIIKDKFVPSKNANKFASMPMPDKARFLYNAYINHENKIIDECARITTPKLKFARKNYPLSGARKIVISCLCECPVGGWVEFAKLSNELLKTNRDLFSDVGDVLVRDDYYNQYYNRPSWGEFAHCAISYMLMEYLAVLGAVDVYTEEASHDDYGERSSMEVAYFRVTELGAYLFGLTDKYISESGSAASAESEKGFLVQPNFDVVIPQGLDRMRHELFFDRFAEKTTADEMVSVYKLNFKSMVQALNIGLYIREIRSYCEAFASEDVPANVITAFEEWESNSARIRIRTVSIIESDDAFLLEEIANYRGMESLSEGRVVPAIVLSPKMENRAKKLIEKNKRFCVLKV